MQNFIMNLVAIAGDLVILGCLEPIECILKDLMQQWEYIGLLVELFEVFGVVDKFPWQVQLFRGVLKIILLVSDFELARLQDNFADPIDHQDQIGSGRLIRMVGTFQNHQSGWRSAPSNGGAIAFPGISSL